MIVNKNPIISEISSQIKQAVTKHLEKNNWFDTFDEFKQFIINEIISISSKYELVPIRHEIIKINHKENHLDLVLYKDEESILSIEVCWTLIGTAITKLLANESEHYLLITIFPDKSLPANLLKRFNTDCKIELLHLPKIKIKNNGKQKEFKHSSEVINVDSPLEKMFTQKLQEKNLNFVSQYAVYEKSYTGVMNAYPKYILDFLVKGEFCKLAIECDGLYYHLRDSRKAHDAARDLWLLKTGFDDVLRFFGDEIRDDLDGCIEKIIEAVEKWDNYYRKKQQKSLIKTSEMNKIPAKEDVNLIVHELAIPIATVINEIKKRDLKKDSAIVVPKIKKLILKNGYSNEIPLLYFTFPELSKYINQMQGLFIGYNVPFAIEIIKANLRSKLPLYIKCEKRLLKIIVLFEKFNRKIPNLKSYVILNGLTGKVMQSDILNVEQLIEEKADANEAKQQMNEMKESNATDDEKIIMESIKVVAACNGNPGDMEYRGIYTKSGKEIFRFGPVPNGTTYIGGFLAMVHALDLMKQKNINLPIYSDSPIAIKWVQQKKATTKLPQNDSTERVWALIERAEKWLNSNTYSNPILKWESKHWGR